MINKDIINYAATDFDAIKSELINFIRETKTFKDVDVEASNINTLIGLYAWLGANFGYYINAVANEPFLSTAKRYKNLNRIAKLLNYNPRGYISSTVDVIGSLTPEYCYGKKDVYIEIPAYSIFPSTKPTPSGNNFTFTNPTSYVYMVQGFGIRTVQQDDFTYNGFKLPYTAPSSFWTVDNEITFDYSKIMLNLSETLPLSVLDRLDPSKLKSFDTENVPLFNPSNPTSIGQPFTRNIEMKLSTLRFRPNITYHILFYYDTEQSKPYLEILQDGDLTEDKLDTIISSIRLVADNDNNTYYTLKEVQNNATGKFYLGVLGMNNLDSINFAFDKLESTDYGIKQIHIDINKDGTKLPFQVLINGQIYQFKSGRLSSQIFDLNSWDINIPYYNVNLTINSPEDADYNYDAKLNVTSKEVLYNEVTIARIYPSYTDPETGIETLKRNIGQRFGNFQAIPVTTIQSSEQKSGFVKFEDGINKIFIDFDQSFTAPTSGTSEYIVSLTPDENVQVWYSDKNEDGFSINIESNTGFDGKVNWIATKINDEETREIEITFNESIPQIDGEDADYTIFLTPSDNIRCWYENKTSDGFKIKTEKAFTGTISYSTFVFSDNQEVVDEENSATQRKGTVSFFGNIVTKDITFDGEFPNNEYGLHMIPNKNVNVWYTNKTTTGFTINIEETDETVSVDWYADYSSVYKFQKHGMVNFSGQLTSAGTLPGLKFENIPETFIVENLKQGNVSFSYINSNGIIVNANNNLRIQFSADRKSINEIKFQIQEETVSYKDIRIFIKNSSGNWEEWLNASDISLGVNIDIDEKVFFVRVEDTKLTEVSFGDGITYGSDPYGKEIIIFGLKTVGQDGNIPPNTLEKSFILSRQILGDDTISIPFEEQFIQLIGLKTDTYFNDANNSLPTVVYDSEGTQITEDIFQVKQPNSAIGGSFPENTEELRYNALSSNLRQDRIVSIEDYASFMVSAFNDIILRAIALSYKDIKDSQLIDNFDNMDYFFNTIFLIVLPKYGNTITKKQRDMFIDALNKQYKAMATVNHEVISAKLIPIDIRIRFKPVKPGLSLSIQTSIQKVIRDYFDRNNHEMGETLHHSDLMNQIQTNISGIDYIEMAWNKDAQDQLKSGDYDIDAVTSATETVAEVKRKKILELLAKDASLINIVEPLLDVKNSTTNKREWLFSQNIIMDKYEFPIEGDIIIELDNN
jgi:hypothetical protein